MKNTTTEVNKLFIYNSLGQLVLENQFTQNEISISVSHLSKGVYFLRVDHGEGVEQVKFVKR
ncbi:T9SS type A sorting domain-containing protein [Flavobacterium piscinae]|uniref:T9SS type A sorting domain-containing protein n=1 Tax=Flavobacterium piscinae TaxID=2506424 RepID=UPI0019C4BB47|nr:T9SS type A sorting domain-containing protein [Flavobacterium piscinae]